MKAIDTGNLGNSTADRRTRDAESRRDTEVGKVSGDGGKDRCKVVGWRMIRSGSQVRRATDDLSKANGWQGTDRARKLQVLARQQ